MHLSHFEKHYAFLCIFNGFIAFLYKIDSTLGQHLLTNYPDLS